MSVDADKEMKLKMNVALLLGVIDIARFEMQEVMERSDHKIDWAALERYTKNRQRKE